jgi:predicted nucleotidyltransferase
MRKAATLDALFPKTRAGILSAAFTRPEKWWYLSELAEYLHTSPSSLQRELTSLVASGILQQRREGTRSYFKANTSSPMFEELRGLFEKTAGLIPTLQQALEPFAQQITCAFVYGSVARGKETATSDVDLMVIGSAGLADLAPALRKAEARLEREINVTHYSIEEFRSKVARKDHFVSTVLRGPKEFVKGSQRDLEEIVG